MPRSCLKLTPPLTPQPLSCAGSPMASGSASPASGSVPLPPLRKTVSFCPALEEFFEADDWDRTPAPVAPKLCYQEILELKQIMKSLPRAPQYPSHRQHFTTSMPQTSSHPPPSSCSSPFPISRFATMPSSLPSKWKNRDASYDVVDREILPYLASVPIQLLPLLPPSEESSQVGTPTHVRSPDPESKDSAVPAHLEPPISHPVPMITPPPSLASSAESSPRPSSPLTSPVSSSPPTPRRAMNFSFLPLLPVEDVAKPSAPPPVTTPPPPPVRKFNMTFVPLLPPEEPAQSPTPTKLTTDSVELTPQNETPPEPFDEGSHAEDSDYENMHSPVSKYDHVSRSYTSTPSLSSASDTDTESEAPSVSSPGPSSPLDDDSRSSYFTSRSDPSDTELLQRNSDTGSRISHTVRNDNPYFPSLPSTSTIQTPRMRALAQATDVSSAMRHQKTQLAAMPSPALPPPSPFSLYPCRPTEEETTDGFHNELTRTRDSGKPLQTKRSFSKRSSVLSDTGLGMSPAMSPELTIEAMRNVPARRGYVEETSLLGPNLSRRSA
ncbi:hypothetical protein BC835DRAFT_663470 [Cytidiella melzeri]|nr:hypothetical protein BC835DRAFT_663470 [Cytidiella melzeri]